MDTNLKKLKEILKIMKKEGVLTLKMDGIELNVDPNFVPQRKLTQIPPTASADIIDDLVELTPEELSEAALLGLSPASYHSLTYSTPLHRNS